MITTPPTKDYPPSAKVVAILCSDIHLSHKPPSARAERGDEWYAAMLRPLDEISNLAETHQCPIICAGDIFDRYNPPPELVNWAYTALPTMYAIPGQHDLRHHQLGDLKSTAYQTLVNSDVIIHLAAKGYVTDTNVNLFPFSWGSEVQPLDRSLPNVPGTLNLAVAHSYIWRAKDGYEGVPQEFHLKSYADKLKGYDAAVFGDNHISWLSRVANCEVYNSGTLLRRKANERSYKPTVGLLHEDGSIIRHFLDTSQDRWVNEDEIPKVLMSEVDPNFDEFLAELEGLEHEALDFTGAIRRAIDNDKHVDPEVKQLLLRAIEE